MKGDKIRKGYINPALSGAHEWGTRVLLTCRNLRDTRVDKVYYSENQEAKHATNALLANRAALTQNMDFVHLKTKVSRSTDGTQKNELQNAPPK